MRRSVAGLAAVLLVAAAGGLWLLQERDGSGSTSAPSGSSGEGVEAGREVGGSGTPGEDDGRATAATDPRVLVSSPRSNAVISSPIAVQGEARGQWYFEGDFPVRLVDADGSEIAAAPARALGEWMTDSLVPFEATLAFEEPAARGGLLVLDRSNPSGLARNAAQAVVPVRFSDSAPPARAVRAYFSDSASGDEACEAVWPVARAVDPGQHDGRAAVGELLEGPTEAERARGFRTNLPGGVELRSLRVEGGTAYVDFDETLERAAGSCRVLAIRAQIEQTLLQLPAVEDVVISIEGEVEQALQP